MDNFSRESLAIQVGRRFTGDHVVTVLEDVVRDRGVPKIIQVDNGPEFISKSLDLWAWSHGVQLDFSRPGKPTDNPFIESFNGKLREECLNQNWFLSLDDAQEQMDTWRKDYNHKRPHRSLKGRTPHELRFWRAGLARPSKTLLTNLSTGSKLGSTSTQPILS